MRWIWIDRILELEHGARCVARKAVSRAEDVVHQGPHGEPPRLPASLVLEGMAQTAGILVGHAASFRHPVILAKVGRARFHDRATAGLTIRHEATLDRIDASGAAAHGEAELLDPASGASHPLASIELVFSHLDELPTDAEGPSPPTDHNFVFTETFMDLLRRSGFAADPGAATGTSS